MRKTRKFVGMLCWLLLLAMLMGGAQASSLTEAQKLDVYYRLVNMNIENGEYAAAIEYIDQCLAISGEENIELNADLYFKKGALLYTAGDGESAVADLEKALSLNPDLTDAQLVLTQIYADREDAGSAIDSLQAYLAGQPDDYPMYATLGQLYVAVGQYADACAAYDTYMLNVEEPSLDAYYMRGVCLLQTQQFALAAEDFGKAIEAEAYRFDAQYNRGVCYLQMGQYSDAEADFAACIEGGAQIDGLYYNRGVSRMAMMNYEAAIADFQTSFAASSYAADSMYNAGVCSLELGEYELAAQNFGAYVEAGGDADLGLYYQAICYMAAEKYEEAATAFAACVEKEYLTDDCRYNMALCLLQNGKYEEAIAELAVSIENGYEVAQSHYYRGVAFAAMGDAESAVAEYTANIEAGQLLATSYYNRAMCYADLGESKKSEEDLLMALTAEDEPMEMDAGEAAAELAEELTTEAAGETGDAE